MLFNDITISVLSKKDYKGGVGTAIGEGVKDGSRKKKQVFGSVLVVIKAQRKTRWGWEGTGMSVAG